MKKFFLILVLVIISNSSFAQALRRTSFDDLSPCEESKGVWREFANGCIDSCEAKLDKFMMCTKSLTYACDCGRGRCWDGKKCTAMMDYRVVFEKRKAREDAELAKARAARREESEENSQIIVRSLVKDSIAKDAKTTDSRGRANNAPNNNLLEFYNPNDFIEKKVSADDGSQSPGSPNDNANSVNTSPIAKTIVKNAKVLEEEKAAAAEEVLNKSLENKDFFDEPPPPGFLQREELLKKQLPQLTNTPKTPPTP